MERCRSPHSMSIAFCALLFTTCLSSLALSKEKTQVVGPDDLTFRLYQLLDKSYGGKLAEFYVMGDIYKNPKAADQELQHVFRAEYDKDRAFGRFRLHVRSVDKLTAEQLKNYTAKQIYEFGEIGRREIHQDRPRILRQGWGPLLPSFGEWPSRYSSNHRRRSEGVRNIRWTVASAGA